MKLIIAGSRAFSDYDELKRVLDQLTSNIKQREPITVISGMARGADQLGERWAKEHGYEVIRMPADWNTHGRSAGYKRNVEMAQIATHLVAFWDGNSPGTQHMINIASQRKLETRIIYI